MNAKTALVVLLVLIVVLGSTGGDDSAAAVGRAIGETVHLVKVAWDAMVDSSG